MTIIIVMMIMIIQILIMIMQMIMKSNNTGLQGCASTTSPTTSSSFSWTSTCHGHTGHRAAHKLF